MSLYHVKFWWRSVQ